jgi:hypothetical protein
MAGELNDILALLEASLAPLSGEPQELDGGITNRNYRVPLAGEVSREPLFDAKGERVRG